LLEVTYKVSGGKFVMFDIRVAGLYRAR